MPARLRILTISVCAASALAFGTPAHAGQQTLTFQTKGISVEGFGVTQATQLIDSPRIDGYVVDFTAEVVDAQGRVQGDDDIMLHHIVVAKLGARDYTCPGLAAERFYAEGEEHTRLVLPQGFGYPNRAGDRWAMLYMLMNHRKEALTGYIRYRVTYVTDEQITPVRPVWLDIRNCGSSEFDVPGTGPKRSTYTATSDFVMPQSGTFVAGGGHLHGGGIRLELRNATCAVTPFTALPTWGGPEPRPLLHEPGPAKMSSFASPLGIPVSAGDTLRLAAVYDNDRPHTRAMGIMVLFFVAGQGTGCRPTPQLAIDLGKPGSPPLVRMPLPRKPTGRLYKNLHSTWVGDYRYGHERISILTGTTFSWRFVGAVSHDVTLVNGPVGFSSPAARGGSLSTFSYRFTRPGTYELFCSLHPVRMTQAIVVRRR